MKCMHVCTAQKAYYLIISLPNYHEMKPDFPSLTGEVAEPCPDMNIKVAAFTVSEKSSNTGRSSTNPTLINDSHSCYDI